ncbi:MAG TPA: hypothetical protein PLP47_05910 [Methanofastidiosum sp.]|jgi:hypothetical protein|nr:hypothetical protein [Methanofastidiosum sp.]
MKKIIAILISLLFIGSTFGVASILSGVATEIPKEIPCSSCDGLYPCLCDGSPHGISMTTVRVGQTFTITHNKQETYWQWIKVDDANRSDIWNEVVANGLPVSLGSVELIDFRAYYTDGSSYDYKEAFKKGNLDHTVYTFRAVRPGTVYFTFKCNSLVPDCCCSNEVVPVRILPNLPMDWILKKFGLGRFKE